MLGDGIRDKAVARVLQTILWLAVCSSFMLCARIVPTLRSFSACGLVLCELYGAVLASRIYLNRRKSTQTSEQKKIEVAFEEKWQKEKTFRHRTKVANVSTAICRP